MSEQGPGKIIPMPTTEDVIHKDDWPCACVKRNRRGLMTHIKLNHPTLRRCRKCGCTREQSEKAAVQP